MIGKGNKFIEDKPGDFGNKYYVLPNILNLVIILIYDRKDNEFW